MRVKITPVKTYWISFSNKHNLGCCIVDAIDPKAAHLKTIDLGINPGGELMIIEMGNGSESKLEMMKWGKDRLITREELIAAQYIPTDKLPDDIQDMIYADPSVTKVCDDCNDEMK